MRYILTLVFTLTIAIIQAQTFGDQVQNPLLANVSWSSVAVADIDGDGDNDIFTSGRESNTGNQVTKLYINNGLGNFTENLGSTFIGVEKGSLAVADVDGDNDLDLFVTGLIDMSFSTDSKLYINDGAGNFSEDTTSSFTSVGYSAAAFADIDGDNDPDLMIAGSSSPLPIAKLYENNSGVFTEITGTPFTGFTEGTINFADVDGDNDMDVLLTGRIVDPSTDYVARLYKNNGIGVFSEDTSANITGVYFSAVDFADIDGDSDMDLLTTGSFINNNVPHTVLYTNDGSGAFTQVVNTPFNDVYVGSVAFADIDGDTDQDVLISGESMLIGSSAIYTNDGSGTFTELTGSVLPNMRNCAIAFADFDGDNDPDIVFTGDQSPPLPGITSSSKIYINGAITSIFEQGQTELNFSIFPNPVAKDYLTVDINGLNISAIDISIFDIKGQKVYYQQISLSPGQTSISVNISALVAGSYIIQLKEDLRSIGSTRIVVEK